MAESFIGEIRLFPFSLIPRGWAACEGQILPIAQNQALFSLLGTSYGGNGSSTFALPDLRGRVPIHFSSALPVGLPLGEETHTLTVAEIPAHTHTVQASSDAATVVSPQANVWASANNLYGPPASLTQMNGQAIASAGGSSAHSNMQPYLALSFCIALTGIYPSRN